MAVVTTVTPPVVVPVEPLVQHLPRYSSNLDLLLIRERHRALKERDSLLDHLPPVPAAIPKIVGGEGSLLEEIRKLKEKVAAALALLEEDQAARKEVQSLQLQLETGLEKTSSLQVQFQAGLTEISRDRAQFDRRCSEVEHNIEDQIGRLQQKMEAEVHKQMQASRTGLEMKFETLESALHAKFETLETTSQSKLVALESALQRKSESLAASVQGMLDSCKGLQDSVSESLKSQTLKLTIFEEKQLNQGTDMRQMQERISKAEGREAEMSKSLQGQKASLEALEDALRSVRSSWEAKILEVEQAQKDGDLQLHRALQKEVDRISDQAQAHAQMAEQHGSLERRVYKLEDDLPKLQVGRHDLVELRTLVQQIDTRTKDCPATQASLTQMEHWMAQMQQAQHHTTTMVEENKSAASVLRGKVAELEAGTKDLADLRGKCGELDTKVTSCMALQDACKAMKVQIQELVERSSKLAPKVDSVEAKLAEMVAKQSELESRQEAYRQEALQKPEFDRQLHKLREQLQQNKDETSGLRKDFMQTKTALATGLPELGRTV